MLCMLEKNDVIFFVLLIFFVLVILFSRLLYFPKYNQTISICESMKNDEIKLLCYSMFLGDLKYCDVFLLPYYSCPDLIFSRLNLNESFCNSFDGYKKTSCFLHLSIKTKNPNFCEMVGPECFYFLASFLNKFSLTEYFCNNINEESLRYTCLAKLYNNASICDEIKLERFEIPDCKAIVLKDLEICKNSTSVDTCMYKVAKETKDKNICSKIETTGIKMRCYLTIENEINVCNTFVGDWRDLCFLEFIYLSNL